MKVPKGRVIMMKQQSYEKSMQRIEEIVKLLENGELTLEESIKLYEEGVKLTAFCNKYLESAQQKIIRLSELEEIGDGDNG